MAALSGDALALLALAGFLSGLVDSIAGGGGLIAVPALLLAGFDPASAVATNKLGGAFATGSAAVAFARAGRIDWRAALPLAAVAFAAAIGGAYAVSAVPADALKIAMPVLLVAMALYFALSRRMRDADAKARLRPPAFAALIAAPVGFYDGLFGPGAGSFYTLGFVTLLGFGLVRASAHTKVLNFASNLGGLLFFIAAGAVVWPAGLAMGAAQFAGAQVGARLAIRHGTRLIRPLLVLVCAAVAIRLMADPAGPLRLWLGV